MFYTIPHTYLSVDFRELFTESGTARWEEVWRNTDVLAVYADALLRRWAQRVHPDLFAAGRFLTDADLFDLGTWLRARRIELCVEAGAVKRWSPDAVRAREVTERVLARLVGQGCRPSSIRIDESLRAGSMIGLGPEEVARLVVDNYVRPLLKEYPALKIGIIEPWPGRTGADIQHYVIRFGEMHALPSFVHLDIDYPRAAKEGHVPELLSALEAISDLGIPLGVIAWSSNFHRPLTSDDVFCRSTLDFAAWMHARFGRFIDDHVVQSWLPFPTRCLPESEEHTFMWLTRQYGRQYVKTWRRGVAGPVA